MPDRRTVNIHGKEYELVASRVERFRKEHPDWSIRTEHVEITENRVIMKCDILQPVQSAIGDKGVATNYVVVATGYAEEIRAANQINKTSALENCETSAIGRALACYGYIGGEYASADEVAGAIKNQSGNTHTRPATAKQKAAIIKMHSEANGLAKDSTEAEVAEWAGSEGIDWSNLTHEDVQKLFEMVREVNLQETNPRDPEEK